MSEAPPYFGYRFEILGKPWQARFCSKGYFKKAHFEEFEETDSGTLAFAALDDKVLYLRARKHRRETVVHEMTHAYLWELCLWSLRKDDPSEKKMELMEEAYCDLQAKYGDILASQVDQIMMAYQILSSRLHVD